MGQETPNPLTPGLGVSPSNSRQTPAPDGAANVRKGPGGRSRTKARRDAGTGSIYREKDGGYRVVVKTGEINPATGKPREVKRRTKTHEEAVKLLNSMTAHKVGGTLRAASHNSVEAFFSKWVEDHIRATREDATYRQYAATIRLHIVPTLGGMKLEDVTTLDVQRLLTSISKTPMARPTGNAKPGAVYSRRSVEVVRQTLRAGFNFAKDVERLIPRNPVEGTSLPSNARTTPKRTALDPVDAIKLLNAAEGSPIRPLLLFLLGTATRISEALGVRWSDLDLDARRVVISGQLKRVEGKGLIWVSGTKTDRARVVALSESVCKMLEEMRGAKLIGDALEHPEGFVFLSGRGTPMDLHGVNRKLAVLCDKAGVRRSSVHIMRHTAATLALDATGDLQGVARMLGHTQTKLTADLYGHVLEGRQRANAEGIERALFGAKKE